MGGSGIFPPSLLGREEAGGAKAITDHGRLISAKATQTLSEAMHSWGKGLERMQALVGGPHPGPLQPSSGAPTGFWVLPVMTLSRKEIPGKHTKGYWVN